MRPNPLLEPILEWYAANQRDLPWRRPDATPWGVLVSEVMLQQTPVSRVLPVWEDWMRRWPVPADLAAEPAGEAVRAWGRLGYPRRALRLHAAAQRCVQLFAGELPRTVAGLRELPGVGEYTAAAVASFAFGERHVVLDTNVRRVLARAVRGDAYEPAGAPARLERRRAEDLLPEAPLVAAGWNVAVMELGALVCQARTPACAACPIEAACAWRSAGSPAWDGPARRGQAYAGTDRQVRGRLLAVLRESTASVSADALASAWSEDDQRERALAGLLADGLVQRTNEGSYALPA
jgi:A/G-specific adenine glycosylase